MKKTVSRFGSRQLLSVIDRLPQTRKFWVGFSGGADSTALLHALRRCQNHIETPIHAIHFHHGLQPEADAWLHHCQEFCAQWSIPFSSRSLDPGALANSNTEEEARNFRYQSVVSMLGCNDIYLTAHHANDHAETLFLNLMRGSGVEGLAGIPELRKLGPGWVARPLLNWNRRELEEYLGRHGLTWMEDPSNQDQSFDRNYLRNHLFPKLDSRWPGLVKRLNRTARNARATSEALADFINLSSSELLGDSHKMPLLPLMNLDPPMQALVLRQWLRLQEIPPPPEVRLLEFLDQLSGATRNSNAEIRWSNWKIKHYRRSIWLQAITTPEACGCHDWTGGKQLDLGTGLGQLQLQGKDVKIPSGWQVASRRGGESIQLRTGMARQKLKELLRQSGFPPWLRAAVPVLYWDGEAVAVGDWFLAHRMKNWLRSNNLKYHWSPADPLLANLRSSCHDLTVDPGIPLG